MSINYFLNKLNTEMTKKDFFYIFALLVLLFPFFNAVWYFPVEKSLEAAVSDAQLSNAENLELQTTLFLNNTFDIINVTAKIISTESEEEEIKMIFSRLFKTNASIIKLLYVDSFGEDIVRTEKFTEETVLDEELSERKVLEDVLITRSLRGESIISDVYLTANLTPVVDIYIPVKSGNKTLGVIGGTADIRTLNNAFLEFGKKNMRAYLVDSRGFVLVHTDPSLVFNRSNVLSRQVISKALNNYQADGLSKGDSYINERGVNVFAVGIPLENGWGVIVEVDRSYIFERIYTIRNIAIAITTIMLAFAIFIIFTSLKVRKAKDDLELALIEAQKLAVIVESSFEGIIIVNASDNIYSYVNPAWEKTTGWTREEVIGKETPKILNSGEHTEEFFKRLWDKIVNGNTYVGEMVNKKKDGTVYDTEVIIIPVRDSKGEITFYTEISRDITKRKKAELESRKQSNELERSNKLMIGRELKMIELKEEIRQLKAVNEENHDKFN